MRQKINQTDEITKIDEHKAKQQLKDLKQSDYDQFIKNKTQNGMNQRQADREYVDRQVAQDEARLQSERNKRETERDMLNNALISQILDKNQRATAASLRFPEVDHF